MHRRNIQSTTVHSDKLVGRNSVPEGRLTLAQDVVLGEKFEGRKVP